LFDAKKRASDQVSTIPALEKSGKFPATCKFFQIFIWANRCFSKRYRRKNLEIAFFRAWRRIESKPSSFAKRHELKSLARILFFRTLLSRRFANLPTRPFALPNVPPSRELPSLNHRRGRRMLHSEGPSP
jgi:hypothetical protein